MRSTRSRSWSSNASTSRSWWDENHCCCKTSAAASKSAEADYDACWPPGLTRRGNDGPPDTEAARAGSADPVQEAEAEPDRAAVGGCADDRRPALYNEAANTESRLRLHRRRCRRGTVVGPGAKGFPRHPVPPDHS